MRTYEQYCDMTEKAINKAMDASADGDQGMYGIHLTAAQVFAQLATSMATLAASRVGIAAVERPKREKNDNAGYL